MKFILLYISLFLTVFSASAQSDWTSKKGEKDIQSYTRIKPGTSLTEVKIIATIARPLASVADALLDYDNYGNWQGGLKQIKLLEEKSESELLLYYEVELPWPMANREFIMTSRGAYESDTAYRIKMLGDTNNTFSSNEKNVRMTDLEGYWLLEAISDYDTKLTYVFYSDPAGDVPAYLVNAFVLDVPYKNIKSLKAYLTE